MILVLLALPAVCLADAKTCTIVKVERNVKVQKGAGPWVEAAANMTLSAEDSIHTGFKAAATLKFADGSEVTVKAMTMIKLQTLEQNGSTVATTLLLRQGEIKATVNDSSTLGSDFRVRTATCTASVRGTRIDSLAYSPALGTTCQMGYEGRILLRTLVGNVMLGADDAGSAPSASDEPVGADGTRIASERTAPAAAFTPSENAAMASLGAPKAGTFTSAGSGLASGAVNTAVEATADLLAINAANETVTGVDLNKDGLVDVVNAGVRLRSPPFVTLPTIPGVVSNCCPLPNVPVPAVSVPDVSAPGLRNVPPGLINNPGVGVGLNN